MNSLARFTATALAAGAATAVLATGAQASARPRITLSPSTVVAGNKVTATFRGTSGRRCTFTMRGRSTLTIRTRASRVVVNVPSTSPAGVLTAKIACGSRSASTRLTIRSAAAGGGGQSTPPSTTPLDSPPPAFSEQLFLTDALPPGVGNPDDYHVQGPADAGGAGYATYWPLATGYQVRITEGQGGSYSHNTVYTRNAVDLGVPQGTPIHAGFTGVVARISNTCAVGNASCGGGFGNYVYLKATDGTCAIMGHLSRVDVTPGQQVPQYAVIGLSGNTGNSTGPHLHYDRMDCNNNHSLPWSPEEGGPLNEGALITSQDNAGSPPAQSAPPANTPPANTPAPPPTWSETVGGNANTWTNYSNAGGSQGPTIPAYTTVQISCKVGGFRVADGNTWWYRIASAPWSNAYFVSADAFYNNGATGGSLHGTPFVDGSVPNC